jgi:hypothetical protein
MVLNSKKNVCPPYVVVPKVGHECVNSKSSFKRISCSCLAFPASSARVLAYVFHPCTCLRHYTHAYISLPGKAGAGGVTGVPPGVVGGA